MALPFHSIWASFKQRRQDRSARTVKDLAAGYHIFRSLLDSNNQAVELLTQLDISLHSREALLEARPRINRLLNLVHDLTDKLNHLDDGRHNSLFHVHQRIASTVKKTMASLPPIPKTPTCLALAEITPAHASMVGNKAAVLAKLKQATEFPVPDGFAITMPACRNFLQQNGLYQRITAMLGGYGTSSEIPLSTIAEIQTAIMAAPLPDPLRAILSSGADPFFAAGHGLAVRSSSCLEDGRRHSFAGQFATILNVIDHSGLETAFRKVAASNFNDRSLAYRRKAGLSSLDFDMAVLCLSMVDAKAAGIMLTKSPMPGHEGILVSAVYGLGEAAVAGSSPTDLFLLNSLGVADRNRSTIADKKNQLVCLPEGGIGNKPVPTDKRLIPVLNDQQLATLAKWGKKLEDTQGCPQDMEWALTQGDELILLQARPQVFGQAPSTDLENTPITNQGAVCASPGIATGCVHLVKRREDLDNLPPVPTILILHQSLPDAVKTLDRVTGILVDMGNPTDHLALVARELGVPMLCGLGNASSRFHPGDWLTMNSEQGSVRSATAAAIGKAKRPEKKQRKAPPMPSDPLAKTIRDLLLPLNLTDANSPDFSIQACKSLHDIIRYTHEKAVLAMFKAGDSAIEEGGAGIHIIDTKAPFLVNVIDLGGGLIPDRKLRKHIPLSVIQSAPLKALLDGIETPGLNWGPPPGGVNIGSVVSNWMTDHRSGRPLGLPNYAIISRDYLNLNARMDFHFTMIDAVCGIAPRSNYVKFRFKGGGTLPVQRQRRARCIGIILEEYGFFTDIQGDMVNGTLQGMDSDRLTDSLVMLGRLLGFTRLLDAAMQDDEAAEKIAGAFLRRDYNLETLQA